jgi:hypothetical protein
LPLDHHGVPVFAFGFEEAVRRASPTVFGHESIDVRSIDRPAPRGGDAASTHRQTVVTWNGEHFLPGI